MGLRWRVAQVAWLQWAGIGLFFGSVALGCAGSSGTTASSPVPAMPRLPGGTSADLVEDATAPLEALPGSRYVALYAPESFAVLMSSDMLMQRFEAEADMAAMPAVQRAEERTALQRLGERFYVVEIHLLSRFGDSSVARDAAAMRGIQASLSDDTGRTVSAAAKQLDSDIAQHVDNASFSAVTVILFPKSDLPGEPELIRSLTQRVTLSLSGLDSRYQASWLLREPTGP